MHSTHIVAPLLDEARLLFNAVRRGLLERADADIEVLHVQVGLSDRLQALERPLIGGRQGRQLLINPIASAADQSISARLRHNLVELRQLGIDGRSGGDATNLPDRVNLGGRSERIESGLLQHGLLLSAVLLEE